MEAKETTAQEEDEWRLNLIQDFVDCLPADSIEPDFQGGYHRFLCRVSRKLLRDPYKAIEQCYLFLIWRAVNYYAMAAFRVEELHANCRLFGTGGKGDLPREVAECWLPRMARIQECLMRLIREYTTTVRRIQSIKAVEIAGSGEGDEQP